MCGAGFLGVDSSDHLRVIFEGLLGLIGALRVDGGVLGCQSCLGR